MLTARRCVASPTCVTDLCISGLLTRLHSWEICPSLSKPISSLQLDANAVVEAPIAIRVLRKEKRLELAYACGGKISLPAELLRVCSPSADTRRVDPRTGITRVVAGRRHVGIMRVEPLGNYAIRIHFDDLHASGIFTWDYLAHLFLCLRLYLCAHLNPTRRWPAMREYLRHLRAAGLSRDPSRKPPQHQQQQQQQQQQQPQAVSSPCGGGAHSSSTDGG